MPDAGRPPAGNPLAAGFARINDVQFDRRVEGAMVDGSIGAREAERMIGNLRGTDGMEPAAIRERVMSAIADPSNGLSASDRQHLAEAFNAVDRRLGWDTAPIPTSTAR